MTVQEFYQHLDRHKNSSPDAAEGRVLAQFLPAPGGNLLDIGCWDGSKTVLINQVVRAGEVHGVDLNPERLAQAARRGLHTTLADLNADLPLPFPAGFFDVIHCGEVIEHVFAPDDLLDEIARLLRPGGYAVLTTPNLASWRNRLVLLWGWQPFFSEVSTRERYGNPLAPRGLPSGHIRLFTPRALCELAHACGLHVERLAGLALSSPQGSAVSRAAHCLDAFIVPRWPTLANGLVARLRKPES